MGTVIYTILIIFILGLPLQAQDINTEKQSSVNVEIHQLTSKVFDNTRAVRALLPPGYHDSENAGKSYPVLYLNDGITVFRRFNIEETVHNLIKTGAIEPLIIVGIDNGGSTDKTKKPAIDRANEFLPYPDVGFAPDNLYEPEPPNTIGKLYPELVSEIMTFINQKYRTKSGAENTGIGGFSYGGVAALYTLMSKPDIFGKLRANVMNHNQYVNDTNEFFVAEGFREREINRVVRKFGNIAHVFSMYEFSTEDGKEKGRGINSIELFWDGARWWISAVSWDEERPNNRIPMEFLNQKQTDKK